MVGQVLYPINPICSARSPCLAAVYYIKRLLIKLICIRPEEASAERLLTGLRGHWAIENKVHWVRDVVFREDVSPVRCGAIPQVMAAMRRTAMSVLRFAGYTAIAKATQYFASKPKLTVKLIK